MKTRHKRLAIIVTGVVGLTVAGLFVLNAFRSNLVFFYSPTEVLEGKVSIPAGKTIRIGGLVEKGSVQRSSDGLKVDFIVTDLNKKLPVHYEGISNLFRGQCRGAGRLQTGAPSSPVKYSPMTKIHAAAVSAEGRTYAGQRDQPKKYLVPLIIFVSLGLLPTD
jgi:cytochrome c-type biogenesis protein CcmE